MSVLLSISSFTDARLPACAASSSGCALALCMANVREIGIRTSLGREMTTEANGSCAAWLRSKAPGSSCCKTSAAVGAAQFDAKCTTLAPFCIALHWCS